MIARRVGRAFCALLIAAGILFGLFLIGPALMGWERYVIVSGSMTGTYDRGSLVFDEVVPTKSLKVGDVITYKPPPKAGPKGLVTHRIVKIFKDPKTGDRVYRTKGDANPAADPWRFFLADKKVARVVTRRAEGRLRPRRARRAQRPDADRRPPRAADRLLRPRGPLARRRRRGRGARRGRRRHHRLARFPGLKRCGGEHRHAPPRPAPRRDHARAGDASRRSSCSSTSCSCSRSRSARR